MHAQRTLLGRTARLCAALVVTPAAVLTADGLRADPPGGRADATAWDRGFVGAGACRVCHEREYADWRGTAHAGAWMVLPVADRTNARCVGCHGTGPGDGGVQCESCHGAGADYWPEAVMRDPHLARALGLRTAGTPEVCSRCHTADVPSLTPFHFKRALPRVDHGTRTPERT